MILPKFFLAPAIALLLLVLSACAQKQPDSSQEIRERTANATAEAKNDAKAVFDGVRDGWNRNNPLDINSARRDQLASLPGVSGEEADRIIAGRPYGDPNDLVKRRIMSKSEYDRISDRVVAK